MNMVYQNITKQYQKCTYIGLVWLLDHPWSVAFISSPQFSFLLPHNSIARFAALDLSSSPLLALSLACIYKIFGLLTGMTCEYN